MRLEQLGFTAKRVGSDPPAPASRDRNIVIIGASFAGNRVAQLLTSCLPPNSPYKVIVIEPTLISSFHGSSQGLCVVEGHETQSIHPYGGNVHNDPVGVLRWVKDRVMGITEKSVQLQESGEVIPYDMLVIATGSWVKKGLPSRVNATDKLQGMELMRNMQQQIKTANTVVVVGGGRLLVLKLPQMPRISIPSKKIILVHSRKAVMNRFGQGLQKAALEGLQSLGVEVILQDRLVQSSPGLDTILLQSGS